MVCPAALHVVPHPLGSWHVQREGEDRPLSEHDSETAAELSAVLRAHATDTPEVVVHDRYDRLHRALP
jgi:hypothetical protein